VQNQLSLEQVLAHQYHSSLTVVFVNLKEFDGEIVYIPPASSSLKRVCYHPLLFSDISSMRGISASTL
jgi:hypothetical protein